MPLDSLREETRTSYHLHDKVLQRLSTAEMAYRLLDMNTLAICFFLMFKDQLLTPGNKLYNINPKKMAKCMFGDYLECFGVLPSTSSAVGSLRFLRICSSIWAGVGGVLPARNVLHTYKKKEHTMDINYTVPRQGLQ